MSYLVVQEAFNAYIDESRPIDKLWSGGLWCEGPCYLPKGAAASDGSPALVWSDIPNNRMLSWDERSGQVSEFRNPSHFTNGHTRDLAGNLVSCEHGRRCISRTEASGGAFPEFGCVSFWFPLSFFLCLFD